MNNVTPGVLMELINEKVKNYGKTLPLVITSGDREKTIISMDPAIQAGEAKTEKVELTLGNTDEFRIEIRYNKTLCKYTPSVSSMFDNSKEGKRKLKALNIQKDTSINDLFKLARISRELAVLSQDLLYTTLITEESLSNQIIASGKFLYANMVNPEAFKSDASKKFAFLDAQRGIKSSIISNATNEYDEKININFLLNQLERAQDESFIEFCYANEKKRFDTSYSTEETIGDAAGAPVIISRETSSFHSIGNQELNGSNKALNRQMSILF